MVSSCCQADRAAVGSVSCGGVADRAWRGAGGQAWWWAAPREAGERGDCFEQQGVDAGLLVGGAAGLELLGVRLEEERRRESSHRLRVAHVLPN